MPACLQCAQLQHVAEHGYPACRQVSQQVQRRYDRRGAGIITIVQDRDPIPPVPQHEPGSLPEGVQPLLDLLPGQPMEQPHRYSRQHGPRGPGSQHGRV